MREEVDCDSYREGAGCRPAEIGGARPKPFQYEHTSISQTEKAKTNILKLEQKQNGG